MKLFLILVGMAVSGYLGYLVEPSLRQSVTGIGGKTAADSTPEAAPAAPITDIDPATLEPEQLPEHLSVKSEIRFSDDTSGLTMTVAPGGKVRLVRVEGSNAVVRPGSTAYTILLPIASTDLLEQLAANPPPPPKPKPAPEPEPAPAPEPPPPPAPEPAPVPEPEPAPAPTGDSEEPAPVPDPPVQPMPEPAPAPEPEPAPAPEPAPEPAPAPQPAPASGPVNVVKVMQDSIRAREIKEFTFDQVLSWKAEPDETVEGEVYQAGSVAYKAETIFGVKTIQAKALIQEGKVKRWIWPKSGMEIK